eukprot:CAMPEP_0182531658 /NCGR_PEP_ID=MMETSP1323-20130603/9523_1 /TAXON_ID=236787 /ORGANISM="Florenciella parvula, Strain RCC1693" /LENGTH=468 /DNA_ID=CAMNT_0024741253 /DNA_START=144 /DNA_END=1546 /DNA_ORIENTATION=+
MGGPCRLPPAEGRSLRRAGPAATDNFQVRPFEYGGHTYHSCEHAYQAMKFTASSEDFRRMVDIVPRVGESDSAHGMRCWNEGQRGSKRAYREDWDCAKVRIMLDVNRAKYAAHADLRADLVATGDVEITGGQSTSWRFRGVDHGWKHWNGRIQMLIREELKPPSQRDQGLIEALTAEFDAYSEYKGHSGQSEEDQDQGAHGAKPEVDPLSASAVGEATATDADADADAEPIGNLLMGKGGGAADFAAALAKRRMMANGSIWASEVLDGQLWLGAGRDAENLAKLQEVGITHIVNVADDVPCFHEALGTFMYQRLDVADFGADKGIARVFHDAAAFVRRALKPAEVSTVEPAVEPTEVSKSDTESTGVPAGVPVSTAAGKVLVHCANGSNRSATVTIALLMLLRTMSLKEAWDHVVTKRPACCPLKDNRAQLLAFEAELYEGRVTMQEDSAKLVPLERGGARRGGAGAG